jgi:hypothetical protein
MFDDTHIRSSPPSCTPVRKSPRAGRALFQALSRHDDRRRLPHQPRLGGLKLAEGRTVIGHKIGLTSRAMQQPARSTEPDYGTLLDDMLFTCTPGQVLDIPTSASSRRAWRWSWPSCSRHPEGPDVTVEQVLAATDYVTPAIEIIDARIEQFDRHSKVMRKVFDTISDNAANAGIVVGGAKGRSAHRPTCPGAAPSCGKTAWSRKPAWPPACRATRPSASPGWPTSSRPGANRCRPGRSCWPARSPGPWPPGRRRVRRRLRRARHACSSALSEIPRLP